EETSIDEAKAQLETNFFGAVRMVNAVLPAMRKAGAGKIINIGSLAGITAIPFSAFYTASKFAIDGYSEALWHEVRPFGIHVTVLEPGFIHTKIGETTQDRKSTRLNSSHDQISYAVFCLKKKKIKKKLCYIK